MFGDEISCSDIDECISIPSDQIPSVRILSACVSAIVLMGSMVMAERVRAKTNA